MKNPLARKQNRYETELNRLLEEASGLSPVSDEYHKVLTRINELDKIHNRTTELKKTVIPTLGTIGAVGGIYALQQFGGVIVPRVVEAIAGRSQNKTQKESD